MLLVGALSRFTVGVRAPAENKPRHKMRYETGRCSLDRAGNNFISRNNESGSQVRCGVQSRGQEVSQGDFNKFQRLPETIKVALTVSFDLISDVPVVLVVVHAGLAE